jgi:signal transduction histidine kinase
MFILMQKILTALTFVSFCVLSNDDLTQELVLSAKKSEQVILLLQYLQQNSKAKPQASIDLINTLSPHLFLSISLHDRVEIELWHSVSLTKLRKHQAALDKLNEILEKNNVEKNELLARIYSTRAQVYNALSEHDSALLDAMLALEYLKDIDYSSQKASILRLKGLIYLYQDKLTEAYEVFLRAKEQYDHVTDLDGELHVLADIAYVYRKFGMLDIALEYELLVVEGREKLGNKEKIVTALHNAALAYRDLSFYEKATQLLNQAIQIETKLNLEHALCLSYIALSEVLRLQNKLDDAERYLKESIKLSNKINNLYTLNRAYLNAGRLLIQKNDLNNAKSYLLKSMAYFTKIKSPKRIALIMLELAILHSKLGQHKAAESYLLKTIKNAQKSNITTLQIRAHKLLADEYAQTNNYQVAFETLKQYQELSKIQFDTNSQRRIELLVVKNQIKETKNNLTLLKQKAKLKESELRNVIVNRNFLILGVICLVGLLGFIYKRRVLQKELSTSEINKAAIAKREQILNVALWASEGVLCHINIKTLIVQQSFNQEGTTSSDNITTSIEELFALIHPDDIKSISQALESIENGKQTAIDVSYRIKGKNTWYWVRYKGKVVIKNEEGDALVVAGIQNNINTLKEQESALRKFNTELETLVEDRTRDLGATLEQLKMTQEHLVAAEKMASLGSLVAGLAHEMNTPVGTAITAVTLIETHLFDLSEQVQTKQLTQSTLKDTLDTIEHSNKIVMRVLRRIVILIEQFKRVSVSRDQLTIGNIYFQELAQTAHKLAHSANLHLEKGRLNIITNCKITAYLDPFVQVLELLLCNTFQHACKGKNLEIYAAINDSDTFYEVTIEDNGVGIHEGAHFKIFDPFYTTKRHSGFVGLGLNIAFNIVVQLLDGEIHCEHSKYGGAKFVFTIAKI